MTRDNPGGKPTPGMGPFLSVLEALVLAIVLSSMGGLAAIQAAPPEGGGSPTSARQGKVPGPSAFDSEAALEASRAKVGTRIGGHTLRDRHGQPVSLDRFRGKPLVVSLVYTSCHRICPMTTRNVAEAVSQARDFLGADALNVATVGFDAKNDDPRALRAFARKQGIADRPNWWLLSGDPGAIDRLTADLGFTFAPTPSGFDHVVQTTVLDGEGRIYRQIYGQDFSVPRLVRPLKELVLGEAKGTFSAQGIVDNVRFFCTVYDPDSGVYRLDYGFFLRVFLGGLVLILIAVFLVREVRKGPPPANP